MCVKETRAHDDEDEEDWIDENDTDGMEIFLILLMMKMICSFLSYVYHKLRLTFGVFHSFTKELKLLSHINLFYSYDHDYD